MRTWTVRSYRELMIITRTILAIAIVGTCLLAATGCAGDTASTTEVTAQPVAPAEAEPEPATDEEDFCTDVTTALPMLDLLVFANNMDDPDVGDRLAQAAAAFKEAAPPSEIAADWSTVGDFFATLAVAFAGVDPTDGEQLRAAQATLDEDIDDRADAATSAGNRITGYATANCDGAAGAATITDACALLTAEDLQRVFPADDPVAAGENFGEGFLECVWTGKNAELIVSLLPAATLATDYTDRMEPLLTSSDFGELADAQAYESMVGIGRTGARGHTVIFTLGGQGVMVAVRLGAEGSRPADVGAAAELAQEVGARL